MPVFMPVPGETIDHIVDSVSRLAGNISVFKGPMQNNESLGQGVAIPSDVEGDVDNLYEPGRRHIPLEKGRDIQAVHIALFERAGINPSNIETSSINFVPDKSYNYLIKGGNFPQEDIRDMLAQSAEEVKNMPDEERTAFDDRVNEIREAKMKRGMEGPTPGYNQKPNPMVPI